MPAVELLQELIRIDTTNPPGNETPAAELLEARLSSAGIKTEIYSSPEGRPNVVGRIEGPDTQPALVLLSHLDVVPVEEDRWTHDPFGGEIDQGYIWGRGTLDMKGIAAMHAAAVMELATSEIAVNRNVIIVSVSDEEQGGGEGARWLVDEHPTAVGFTHSGIAPEVIGEGAFGLSGIVDRPLMPISMGEKSALWLTLIASGEPGHGAMPPKQQAALNLTRALRHASGFHGPRVHPIMREQFRILSSALPARTAAPLRFLGSPLAPPLLKAARGALASTGRIGTLLADTVVVTQLQAGYKHNVIPGEASAALDCRLLPGTDIDGFIAFIEKKVKRFSVRVEEHSRNGGPSSEPGPAFDAMRQTSEALPVQPLVVPSLTPGITDIRYFRAKGATGYGWVPLVLSAEELATIHGHDERIPVDGFEQATAAMTEVVRRVST